jgi:hypothetical protein
MAAGGFRTFVAGETLDEEKINDFLMQGILVFDDATARDAAITAPVEGQFAFLKSDDKLFFYDSVDWVEFETEPPRFDFLVIAGGGGGGRNGAGGGGAGGYRCSVDGENSGGGKPAVVPATFTLGETFRVTIGAGGAGRTGSGGNGLSGTLSEFYAFDSTGGGGAGSQNTVASDGGSGGGRGDGTSAPGQPRNGQGFVGGGTTDRGGGGGASAAGSGFNGGNGVSSSITGTAVTRGGGGAATGGTGGTGGGGNPGAAGGANTGGGGGGGTTNTTDGANGGSGFVALKYPDTFTLTVGAGLTSSTSTAGGFKVTTFTAGTDTVTVA